MTTEDTQFTVGKTTFYQGEHGTHPLFRIEPGIPCRDAREQSSELMGYVRELTITGLMDEKPMMIWAAHYLSAMAKALQTCRYTPAGPLDPADRVLRNLPSVFMHVLLAIAMSMGL